MACLFAVLLMGSASAFLSPRPIFSHARIRGRIRSSGASSTSLFVSLEPPATVSEGIELKDVQLNDTSGRATNATLPEFSIDVAELSAEEIFIPIGETDEEHMERVRRGDDVEELTHLLAHDEGDLQPLTSPAIPVSYDECGLVQAECVAVVPVVPVEEVVDEGGELAAVAIAEEEGEGYPPFVRFLYQKDDNGQTLASKLFNTALLAISFGYVATLVFTIDKGMTRGWTPGEIGMRIPLDTWASYENSLSEKPVATKTIINVIIYLLGDWLSQTLFQKKNVLDFDALRTIKNGFVGMCFGPAVHEYYEFSDWVLPVEGATFGLTNRAFKILMDQTIYLSIKCSIYIMAIGVLNGDTVEASAENVKGRIKPIMFTAWKFWPLVHCVTYGLIPARHRILWVNSVDLVWNAILASKARDDGDEDNEDGEAGESVLVGEGKVVEANCEAVGGELDILAKLRTVFPTYVNEEEEDASSEEFLGAQWEDDNQCKEEKKVLVGD